MTYNTVNGLRVWLIQTIKIKKNHRTWRCQMHPIQSNSHHPRTTIWSGWSLHYPRANRGRMIQRCQSTRWHTHTYGHAPKSDHPIIQIPFSVVNDRRININKPSSCYSNQSDICHSEYVNSRVASWKIPSRPSQTNTICNWASRWMNEWMNEWPFNILPLLHILFSLTIFNLPFQLWHTFVENQEFI